MVEQDGEDRTTREMTASRRAIRAVSSVASSMERGVTSLAERGSPKFPAWGMTITQYSFQISGAVVALPFAYATLGWCFALIIQLGWLGANFLVAKLTDDVIQRTQGKQEKHDRVKTLGDVGGALYGRPGRIIATTMQVLVMFAILLIELDLAAQTLQYLASYPFNCLGYWSLMCWVCVDLDRLRRAPLPHSLALCSFARSLIRLGRIYGGFDLCASFQGESVVYLDKCSSRIGQGFDPVADRVRAVPG